MCEAKNFRAGRQSADDGVTIVELLIALVVVMIVFAGLAATMTSAFASIRNTETRVRAVALGNELLEEMATVPWNQLGLEIDDPDEDDAEFPADGNGELVVWLDSGMNPAIKHPDEQEPEERDGRTYEVERWVTLVEEDDQAGIKRMVVIISWEVGGQSSSIRTEGLRAPEPEEFLDLDVSVEAVADNEFVTAMRLDSDDKNEHPFTVTATLGAVPATNIQLRFTDRAFNEQARPGSDTVAAGENGRAWTIGAGEVPFPHGRTTFTVLATGPDGQIASDTATLRFYEDLEIKSPDVTQGGDVVGDEVPRGGQIEVRVDTDGELCEPLQVEVDVHGMTSGEAVPTVDTDGNEQGGLRLAWNGQEIVMGLLGERKPFGGTFWAEINPDQVDSFQAPDDVVSFEIVADRLPPSEDPDVQEEFKRDDTWAFSATAGAPC